MSTTVPFIADLHIHSRFSRATSRDLNLFELAKWGKLKGIGVIGTGDITHPGWLSEIGEHLTEDADTGLFRLKKEPGFDEIPAIVKDQKLRFMLTGEISTIYSYGGKTRKVHHVVCLPNLDAAHKFTERLERIGNIRSDGRPILGLDSRNLLEILLEVSSDAVLIPAHIWTPWFSVLGSKSGFDAIEECYRDLSSHIFALETGLSSDPPMNRMVTHLDRYSLVSNSDAHSAANLGREANRFSCDMTYSGIMSALRTGTGFDGTLEFFPEEGKYHLDGHRKCNTRLEPEESARLKGICPVCKGQLTLGVLFRVWELADRKPEQVPSEKLLFRSMLSLDSIIGETLGVGPASKKVQQAYLKLIDSLGPELSILLESSIEDIERSGPPLIGEAIRRVRAGKIRADAGYDGEYGTIRVFEPGEMEKLRGQTTLLSRPAAKQEKKRALVALSKLSCKSSPSISYPPPVPNADQQRAVEHVHGPLLVVAGPGTGKTRTLVERIVHLVTGGHSTAQSILAVTFSNRAAREMEERIDRALPDLMMGERPEVTTFHRLGLLIVSENAHVWGWQKPPTVLSDQDTALLTKRFLDTSPEEIERTILNSMRDGALELPQIFAVMGKEYEDYFAYKNTYGLVDFTDLLLLPVILLSTNDAICSAYQQRWMQVFVDEFQDINALQYRLIRLLVPPEGNLFAIGDPNQAIYSFRGSDVRFFEISTQDYSSVRCVPLVQSYRCSQTILDAAAAVIAPYSKGGGHVLRSAIKGPPIEIVSVHSEKAEAEYVVKRVEALIGGSSHFAVDSGRSGTGEITDVGFNDIAILYRTHFLGDAIEEALNRSGIPLHRPANRDLRSVNRILACLRFCIEPTNATLAQSFFSAMPASVPTLVCHDIVRALETSGIPASSEILEHLQTQSDFPGLTTLANQVTTIRRSIVLNDSKTVLSLAVNLMGISPDEQESAAFLSLQRKLAAQGSLSDIIKLLAIESDGEAYDPRAEGIALLTLHAAKGLEWKVVFIVGCDQGLMPYSLGNECNLAEESRLMYVGMTRAQKELHLLHAGKRSRYGKSTSTEPSEFLSRIPAALCRRSRPQGTKKIRPEPDGIQIGLFDAL